MEPTHIRAILAEDERLNSFLVKLRRMIYDILNGDAEPNSIREAVSEWRKIDERIKARGGLAYVVPGKFIVVASPFNSGGADPLGNVPDENPQ